MVLSWEGRQVRAKSEPVRLVCPLCISSTFSFRAVGEFGICVHIPWHDMPIWETARKKNFQLDSSWSFSESLTLRSNSRALDSSGSMPQHPYKGPLLYSACSRVNNVSHHRAGATTGRAAKPRTRQLFQLRPPKCPPPHLIQQFKKKAE